MATFTELFASAWRQWNTDGVPSSLEYEPEKAEIRSIGPALDTAFADLLLAITQAGIGIYETKADLDATLSDSPAPVIGEIAMVLADTNSPPENGWFKLESGPTWTLIRPFNSEQDIFDYIDGLIAAEAAAREAADDALDTRVTAAEEAIDDLVANGANEFTATRIADGLGIFASLYRNYRLAAQSNKAIDTTGALVTASGRYATGFIEVTATMSITRMGSPVTSGSYVPFAFYDAAQAFLGYAWAAADVTTINIADDAPVNTRYVRLTSTNSTVEYYGYEPSMVALIKDMLFSLYGTPIDNAGNLSAQYVNKTTGAVVNSSSFRMTAALTVGPTSYIACGGGLISNTDTTQCQIAFYEVGASPEFLGYYNPVAVNQVVRVADLFPTATAVRVTFEDGATGPVHIINTGDGLDRTMDMVHNGAIVDYFAPALVEGKRLNLTGGTTQAGHEYWRTSKFYIPVVEGQVFYVTCQDCSSLAAVIAGYDANQLWVSNLLVGTSNQDFLYKRVEVPAGISYIRGTYRNDVEPFSLQSVRPAQALTEGGDVDVVALAPDAAYGRLSPTTNDAAVYLFARGVVGDRAVSVGWAPGSGEFDKFQGDEKLRIVKTAAGDATIKTRVTVGSGFEDLDAFPLYLTNVATAVSPDSSINIVVIGDSTTSQLSSGDGDSVDGNGTWVNEMARQLTGTGDQALTPDVGTMTISAPFVSGNSISGTITDGTTPKTVGPVAFDTDSNTTLSALAAAIQAKVLEYTAAAGSTAVRSGNTDILVSLTTKVAFSGFLVTGGASQATISDDFTPMSGGTEVDTGREWAPVYAADIRAPLALSNIHFRGTRGTGTIKHEGRGGWHPINYLQRNDTITLKISAPFVSGNSISGEVTDGTTIETVGPVAFDTDSATTLAALAAAVETAMLEFGAGPTAVVKDADEVTLKPKFNLAFNNFIVTGGASQATVTFGDNKFNAFWDPGGTPWGDLNSQFSMQYYIESNGWDDGTIVSGVESDGANLLVIIPLGWNDVGNDTGAGPSATYMSMILDKIHEEYPQATVWIPSLWGPPTHSFKGNPSPSVTKYYDPAEIFREAVHDYGLAYRAICEDRSDYARFIQVSHQIDPDYAFSKATYSPNGVVNDPSLVIEGTGDHVHMRRRGYAMLASVMADAFLYHYCRP